MSSLILQSDVINVDSNVSTILIPGATGLQLLIYKLLINSAGTTTVTFYDGTNVLTGPISLVANQNLLLDLDESEYFIPWFVTSPNNPFIITNSADVQLSGIVYYSTKYPSDIQVI